MDLREGGRARSSSTWACASMICIGEMAAGIERGAGRGSGPAVSIVGNRQIFDDAETSVTPETRALPSMPAAHGRRNPNDEGVVALPAQGLEKKDEKKPIGPIRLIDRANPPRNPKRLAKETKTSMESEPPRASTSERLHDTAARLFWTKGYASTTTREIAELLGVRKASLYHHINSKEDLLFEISVISLERIIRDVQTAIAGVDDSLERVRKLVHAHVMSMIADQDKHSVMLTELRALTPARRKRIVALRDEYERVVVSVLAAACAAGVLRADIPVKYLSLSLLNLMNWSIFWFQSGDELSPEGLADYLTAVYLGGAQKSAEGQQFVTKARAETA